MRKLDDIDGSCLEDLDDGVIFDFQPKYSFKPYCMIIGLSRTLVLQREPGGL